MSKREAPEGHEHRHSILVGHAPITMTAGKRLPELRECACGDQVTAGTLVVEGDGRVTPAR